MQVEGRDGVERRQGREKEIVRKRGENLKKTRWRRKNGYSGQ